MQWGQQITCFEQQVNRTLEASEEIAPQVSRVDTRCPSAPMARGYTRSRVQKELHSAYLYIRQPTIQEELERVAFSCYPPAVTSSSGKQCLSFIDQPAQNIQSKIQEWNMGRGTKVSIARLFGERYRYFLRLSCRKEAGRITPRHPFQRSWGSVP